jgi:hypothetical protein
MSSRIAFGNDESSTLAGGQSNFWPPKPYHRFVLGKTCHPLLLTFQLLQVKMNLFDIGKHRKAGQSGLARSFPVGMILLSSFSETKKYHF